MSNVKMFTHGDDLDGRSCPLVLSFLANYTKVQRSISYESYNTINESIVNFIRNKEYEKFSEIYITDMGIKPETAALINKVNNPKNKFILIDHHDTNDHLNNYSWAYVRSTDFKGKKISATKLLYQRLVVSPYGIARDEIFKQLSVYVNLVSDYDTYTWKVENNPVPKNLNTLLKVLGYDRFYEHIDCSIINDNYFFDDKSNFLVKLENDREDKFIQNKLDHVKTYNIKGYTVGVTFCENKEYISELGNRACEQMNIDLLAMINITTNEVSYRSTKNTFHLGKDFAALFGGGGHDKSAGSEFSELITNRLIFDIFDLKLNDLQ